MKHSCLIILFFLIKTEALFAQSKQPTTVSAASSAKRINTYALFDIKPEEKKTEQIAFSPEVKSAEKVKTPATDKIKTNTSPAVPKINKETVQATKREVTAVPVKAVSFKPEIENKPPVEAVKGAKVIYFDRQNRQLTKQEKAYYYRTAKFEKADNQPKGPVVDFYYNTDKPKFIGQFNKYENTYEDKNTDYDGKCTFYEESGAYTVKNFANRRLISETRFSEKKEIMAQIEYGSDGKRKKFTEYVFDKSGTQIGNTQGSLNPNTGVEEAKQQIFYSTGQIKSIINYQNECPTTKGIFYKENGEKYEAYFQNFDCEPNSQAWKFSNKSYFQTTFKKEAKTYKIMTVEEKQEGILQLTVPYDFYKKSFEIEAVFDLSGLRPINEFGIVWEFQDQKNYSYLKVNVTNKTYEVNSIRDGIRQKYMSGVKPMELEIGSSQAKISFKKIGQESVYSVNDAPLKYIRSNGQSLKFDKFARVSLDRDYKTWGIGFYFKSGVINESIILKSFEIKLL